MIITVEDNKGNKTKYELPEGADPYEGWKASIKMHDHDDWHNVPSGAVNGALVLLWVTRAALGTTDDE